MSCFRRPLTSRVFAGALALCSLLLIAVARASEDPASTSVEQLEEAAFQQALDRVAPSLVRIDALGGGESPQTRVGDQPAVTGLIVSSDGLIITSAFGLRQRPPSIVVTLADGQRYSARLVARDLGRMLALLKIDPGQELVVPQIAPVAQLAVGQWALAVGRTMSDRASISVGIVSALDRIWGKAVQTDAKVSPHNYGGPLVDIEGRVIGVLVPLSPDANKIEAGAEWYDSGIGFAVPLEVIQELLPRLAQGSDLQPGLLGVNVTSREGLLGEVLLASVRRDSPADRGGMQRGDRVVEVDGHAVERVADFKRWTQPRYAGDTLSIVVLRDGKRVPCSIELDAKLAAFRRAIMGIRPLRGEAPGKGVTIAAVVPESGAAQAGLLPLDVVKAVGDQAIESAEAVRRALDQYSIGQTVKIKVERAGSEQTLEVVLNPRNTKLEDSEPGPPVVPSGPAVAERPAVGRVVLEVPGYTDGCVAMVPGNYDPRVPMGLGLWLDGADQLDAEGLPKGAALAADRWQVMLLVPKPLAGGRWSSADVQPIASALAAAKAAYRIDSLRVASVGIRSGNLLATALANANDSAWVGLAVVDNKLPLLGRENDPEHPLTVLYLPPAGMPGRQVSSQVERWEQAGFSTTRAAKSAATAAETIDQVAHWIDGLDEL